MQKWRTRGVVRGATMGLCIVNMISGGMVYAFTKQQDSAEKIAEEGDSTA